ncbi:MAG: ribokinase [Verrucomicrobiales bacterium]|nr:ribokinase [Verrucomicrobiales bacterium]
MSSNNGKSYDVVVIGGINTDYLVRGTRLPRAGETVDGKEFLEAPGGKGANQAVAAARLGARVAFAGCVGNDARGTALLRGLKAEGIHTAGATRASKAPTGVALIMVEAGGEKQILVAPGANHALSVTDLEKAKRLLGSTRVLLIQFEVPMKATLWAARLARAAGACVVLDPAPPAQASRDLLSLVDVVRPNASEAEALTGLKVKDVRSARRAAEKLLAQGIKLVATQAGDEGDLLVWNGGEKLLPRIKVKSVDATGAGDAFAAGLAVALAEGQSYEAAGALANAAAALATTKFGAQPAMPFRREVERLMKRGAQV